MRPITAPTESSLGAFVLVPFESQAEAAAWAAVMSSERAEAEPPILVTEGTEDHWVDPATGEVGYEVTFAGGWRAKVAGSGQVTIGKGGRPYQRDAAA
jgi:hypothetical protein